MTGDDRVRTAPAVFVFFFLNNTNFGHPCKPVNSLSSVFFLSVVLVSLSVQAIVSCSV